MRSPIAAAAWLAFAAIASAQPALSPQLVEPPPGELSGVSLPAAAALPHGAVVWGVHSSYARRPLRLLCLRSGECDPDASGGSLGTVVEGLAALELSLSLGLFDALELGLVVGAGASEAAHASSTSTSWREPQWAVGATDLRASLKIPLWSGPVELSGLAGFVFPTGAQHDYLGGPGWVAVPGVVARTRAGSVEVSTLLAYRLRQGTTHGGLELDDELHVALALDVGLTPSLGMLLETQLRAGVGGRTFDRDEQPVESLVGLRIDLPQGLQLRVAVGTGVWPAPDGYGTSDYRVVVDLRGRHSAAACVLGPEDFDGYQDADYCADPDNDGDGLLDVDDACPNDAEDHDGFADDDGCPDLDNDADGLPDSVDRCPDRSEDRDGYQDWDGCPELDNDSDGLPDGQDLCPMDPEDLDGYQDEDGCPEPGPQRLAVTVTDTRILVSDRIYFEYDAAVIRAVSMPTLDEVARAILSLGGERGVRVEGHTDARGSAEYNLDLSFRRARAVLEYLVSRGVPERRLSHIGFGGQKPLVPGNSPEGSALNRRVEFAISPDSGGDRLDNSVNSGD